MKPRIKTAGKGGSTRQKQTVTREQEASSGLRRGLAVDLLIERLDDEGIGVAHSQGQTDPGGGVRCRRIVVWPGSVILVRPLSLLT